MPYGLIPDGYTLKKITKQQENALKQKRRHDNVEAFVSNPGAPFLVGGVLFTGVLSAIVAAIIIELELPDTDEVKERLEAAAKRGLKSAGGAGILGKIIRELIT